MSLMLLDLGLFTGVCRQVLQIVHKMMNHCVVQQNAFAACDEIWSSISIPERKDPVVCPRPLRLGLAPTDPAPSLRWHLSHQADFCDPSFKAGNELLDIILSKSGGGYCVSQAASSPPFFCGSPPSRAPNPVIHDARFGESPVPAPVGSPSGLRSKGCVRAKFGQNPAAVRIEGFECDRRGCGIPALA